MAYIDFLVEKHFNQDLSSYIDKDHDFFRGQNQFSMADLKVNELIKFYLDNNATPSQLVNRKGKLPEILYGPWFQTNSKREHLISIFLPEIKNNYDFFKECFNICLESHNNIYLNEYFKNTSLHEDCIKENEKLFRQLIEIGKEKNWFNDFESKELYTTNPNYQKILQDAQLNESKFSMDLIKGVFKECIYEVGYGTHKKIKVESEPINKFFQTYIEQIIDSFYKNDLIIGGLETWENGKEVKSLFLNTLLNENYKIEKEKLEKFILDIIKTPSGKAHVCDSYSGHALNIYYPNLIIPFLETLTQEEKNIFFELKNYGDGKYEKWLTNIGKGFEPIDINVANNLFEYFYNNVINHNVATEENYVEDRLIKFNKVMTTTIINYCKNTQKVSSEEAQFLMKKHIGRSDYKYLYSSGNDSYIAECADLFNQMNDENKKKLKKKIVPVIQDKLYNLFGKEDKEKNYYRFNRAKDFENLVSLLRFFDCYEVLDVLNVDAEPIWKKIVLDINDKNIKGKYDYPFAFELIERSSGKALEWFGSEENINHLAQLKFAGKNFIANLKTNRDKSVNEEAHLRLMTKIIKEAGENGDIFNKLILDNKPALKLVTEMNDKDLNDLIFYHKLENKVDKKLLEPVKVQKKKI